MLSTPFDVYLNDHLALIVGERQLCRRVLRQNSDTPIAEAIKRQVEDCCEGETLLKAVLKNRGASVSSGKRAAAWLAEKAGRLKLNGRLTSYSPGSRVLELEGLVTCAQARLLLWRCLAANAAAESLSGHDWATLALQAEEQVAQLRGLHQDAARGLAEA